jgi:hypothetical protein
MIFFCPAEPDNSKAHPFDGWLIIIPVYSIINPIVVQIEIVVIGKLQCCLSRPDVLMILEVKKSVIKPI